MPSFERRSGTSFDVGRDVVGGGQVPTAAIKYAAKCFELAETAGTPSEQDMFLNLAEAWLRVASQQEQAQSVKLGPSAGNGKCDKSRR